MDFDNEIVFRIPAPSDGIETMLVLFAIGYVVFRHRAHQNVGEGAPVDSYQSSAVLGAVATAVLSFVPFSPILGGGVAGYLQGGSREQGVRIGAYSGVIAAIPIVLGALILGSVFLIGAVVAPRAGLGLVIILLVLGLSALYTVGLSALGGYLGAYIFEEYGT